MSAIDEYLERGSEAEKAILNHIRDIVHQEVPDATETISYAMPTFQVGGKSFFGFAINSRSLSVYPFSGATLREMKSDITPYQSAISALKFTVEKPIPDAIVREAIDVRLKQMGVRG